MFNTKDLEKKWSKVLNHKGTPPIQDAYKRSITARLLENQEIALKEERGQNQSYFTEASNMSVGGGQVGNYDPVLISLVRRAMPNIIAYDIAGVQPMTMPTGLIFAMKSKYRSASVGGVADGDEALFDAPDTAFSGNQNGSGGALSTADAEALDGSRPTIPDNTGFGEMGFEITKTDVVAESRALRASYTTELAHDLKQVHGLDAESELANILSTEILAEINREILDGVNVAAKQGAAGATLPGTFDLNADSDGRWAVEKFKSLIFAIHRECNKVAIETRRGKGNILIVSADVASALSAASVLDIAPSISTIQVDPTGNLFAGVIAGNIKVYVDPFAANNYVTVGYRGPTQYDAGVFYCPYVPLTMMRAVGEDTFQPRIGFKTRYGLRCNPFVTDTTNKKFGDDGTNVYYRRFLVNGLDGV